MRAPAATLVGVVALALFTLFTLLASTSACAEDILPPQVLASPPALYPPKHSEASRVSLRVVVGLTGAVESTEVVESGGPDFDQAAVDAVKKWKFAPATRDGKPFVARVKIPFIFSAPPAAGSEVVAGGVEDDGGLPPPVGVEAPLQDAGEAPSAGVDGGELLPSPDAGPPPAVVQVPVAPLPELDTDAGAGIEEVSVRGARKRVNRGGSDFEIQVGQLAQLVSSKPSDILQLAPGIFIANEGGAGHADQVFLRGFDAEQGQAIEFTVNGVPINEVDNTDGHGYADTHFIIPEVVKNLRVIEGPFDPHQGDFAEAGSAEYQLGVPDRRLEADLSVGDFNTQRALVLWAPEHEREGTFAAAQFYQSAGFGVNRASTDASAMAQYEGELGQRGLWRLLGTAYSTHFKTAGDLREDDFQSGRVSFYGTEDPSQGGDAQRYTLSADVENPLDQGVLTEQVFLTWRVLRINEDFTGFLLDTEQPGQSIHPQRGDGIEQDYSAFTAGDRGSYKRTFTLFGRPQTIEAGFYARYDHTTPVIQRVRFGTQIPYALDEDLVTDIFNLAGYLDVDLHPLSFLTLRGGVREEYFNYDVNDLCATSGDYIPNGPLNQTCPSADLSGPRIPTQRATATGLNAEPKGTALVQLPWHLSLTGSAGVGAQSLDARYISQDELAPFAAITAEETGVLFQQRFEKFELSGRALYYNTHVGQDLIFNPDLGRLATSSGTTRRGAVFAGRFTGRWWDELASFTSANAEFDQDKTLVPYVPTIVARSDTAVFGSLPWRFNDHPFTWNVGLGISYVGERPLPFSQVASPTLSLDGSASLRWSFIKLGVLVENLTDTQYPLSEFFYASDFRSRSYPTLTPTELFTAAPPRMALFTLSVILDKESER